MAQEQEKRNFYLTIQYIVLSVRHEMLSKCRNCKIKDESNLLQ